MAALHRSARVVVLAASVALALAACGGGSSPAGTAAAPATSVTLGDSPSASATTSSDAGGAGCAGAAPVEDAVTALPGVTKVQIIGGCHQASIETSLAPGIASFTAALAICDAAAKAAYDNGLSSVSVDGSDGHELAAGINGAPCIGG